MSGGQAGHAMVNCLAGLCISGLIREDPIDKEQAFTQEVSRAYV